MSEATSYYGAPSVLIRQSQIPNAYTSKHPLRVSFLLTSRRTFHLSTTITYFILIGMFLHQILFSANHNNITHIQWPHFKNLSLLHFSYSSSLQYLTFTIGEKVFIYLGTFLHTSLFNLFIVLTFSFVFLSILHYSFIHDFPFYIYSTSVHSRILPNLTFDFSTLHN